MEREIKFKYVCKRGNGHIFSEIFTLEQIEGGKVEQWLTVNSIGGHDKVYRLLFTGLKDKNGLTEIYEGDIIRYRCLVCVNKDLKQTYDEVVGVVEYQGSCFTAGMKQGYYSNYLLYELDKYEVIGNIYENPELVSPTPNGEGE